MPRLRSAHKGPKPLRQAVEIGDCRVDFSPWLQRVRSVAGGQPGLANRAGRAVKSPDPFKLKRL